MDRTDIFVVSQQKKLVVVSSKKKVVVVVGRWANNKIKIKKLKKIYITAWFCL